MYMKITCFGLNIGIPYTLYFMLFLCCFVLENGAISLEAIAYAFRQRTNYYNIGL